MEAIWADMFQPAFWVAAGQIIGINIILSGDNAVVIALACRQLPPHLRTKGVVWGTAGAILIRVVVRLLFPPKPDALHLRVRCHACGWTGTVGKFMRKCSRCNADAVEVLKK